MDLTEGFVAMKLTRGIKFYAFVENLTLSLIYSIVLMVVNDNYRNFMTTQSNCRLGNNRMFFGAMYDDICYIP